jgi:hypothetical protein
MPITLGDDVIEKDGLSDARAGNVLKDNILSSIEVRSLLSDGRPYCLILDEIDGAHFSAGDQVCLYEEEICELKLSCSISFIC